MFETLLAIWCGVGSVIMFVIYFDHLVIGTTKRNLEQWLFLLAITGPFVWITAFPIWGVSLLCKKGKEFYDSLAD